MITCLCIFFLLDALSKERKIIESVNVSVKWLGNVLQFSGVIYTQVVSFASMGLFTSVVVSGLDKGFILGIEKSDFKLIISEWDKCHEAWIHKRSVSYSWKGTHTHRHTHTDTHTHTRKTGRKEWYIEWKQQECASEKIRLAALCTPYSFLISWCSIDSQGKMKQAI